MFEFIYDVKEKISIGTLANLTLHFVLQSKAVLSRVVPLGGGPARRVYLPAVSMGLETSIPLGGGAVRLLIDLSNPEGLLQVTADVSAIGMVGLGDFPGMSNNADLHGSLPPQSLYDPGGRFGLAGLTLAVNPSARSLAWVDVQLQATPDWTILGNVVLKQILFDLKVFDPLGSTIVVASLSAVIQWPDGSLVVGGTAPQVTVFIELRPNSQIHLITLLNKLLSTDVPGDLYIDELSFVASPAAGSLDLTTGIKGEWSVDLGVTTATLNSAWLQLDRANGATTGTIAANADIGIVNFDGVWNIPGNFTLTGKLNRAVDLNSLIDKLTNIAPPSGLMDVSLTAANATIAMASWGGASLVHRRSSLAPKANTVYTFQAQASASSNGVNLGTALFEVRASGGKYGFLIGFVVPAAWSPGDLLPELKSLFDGLSFSDSGLLISSISTSDIDLPNLKQKSLPSSMGPGILAFATLSLSNNLGILSSLFPAGTTLNLSALLDMNTPVNSVIEAKLMMRPKQGDLQFVDFKVILKPRALTFSLVATIALTVGSETVTVAGSGSIGLKPAPSFNASLIIANWVEPFGITNLTIVQFGLGIGIAADGIVTIGFLGSFLVGSGARQFRFLIAAEIIDFEAPGAILFNLEATSKALMLSDLIKQFTTLDLSHVPVLNAIGFKKLDLYIVDDPNGFTIGTQHFAPGIRIDADILIYDWEASFDLAVNTSRGIYAKGSINNPIIIGDNLLVISDSTGTNGPSGLIDTSAFVSGSPLVSRVRPSLSAIDFTRDLIPVPRSSDGLPVRLTGSAATYLEMDASVSLLGVYRQTLKVSVSSDTFDFLYQFGFLGISETLTCALNQANKSFAASAKFSFNLDVTTPALVIEGVTVFPSVHIQSPSANLEWGSR